MHNWSDDSFDWKALNEAIEMLASFMRRWGRIGVHAKEKFGTARVSVYFWDGSLHGLCYPGFYSSQFPHWLWHLDIRYIAKLLIASRLNKLVYWYQRKVYSKAYNKVLAQFPNLKTELVCMADFPELIKEHDAIMAKYKFVISLKRIILPVQYDYDAD